MPLRPATIWADLAVLGVAVVWGASYPVAKEALIYAPVALLIFYRFLIAALIMSALAWRDLVDASCRDLLSGGILGTILFLIFVAETLGIALTTATNAALIISLCTVFTAFLDFGAKRKLPPSGIILGAGIAVIGVAVLTNGLTALGTGDLLILVAAALRAIMVVSTKHLIADLAISSAALTALQAITVSIFTFIVIFYSEGAEGLLVDMGLRFWGAIGFLSLICTIAAFYIQNAALRRTSPTRVSLLMGTEPLFGYLFAVLLLGEALAAKTLGGAVLIVGGTLYAVHVEKRRCLSEQESLV